MKNKKIFSVTLALAMILALSAAVFADNGISGENNINVSYTAGQHYEVVIPTESLAIGDSTDLTIKAQNVLLPEKKKLQVSMSSDNGFALTLTDGNVTSSIPYTVKLDDSEISSGSTILTVESGKTVGEVTLVASVGSASAVKLAGTHKDILHFTCEVTDIATETTTTDNDNTEGGNEDSSSDTETSSSSTKTQVLDAGDEVGQAGQAGQAAAGGGQELGPYGENPRPTSSDPEPQPPHPDPYSWQSF